MSKIICEVKSCIHNEEGICKEEVVYIRRLSHRCINCIDKEELEEED